MFVVTVDGSVKIKDDSALGRDHRRHMPVDGCVRLAPGQTCDLASASRCVGGEVRVEIDLEVRAFQNCVRVTGTGSLFEGSNCRSTNCEDQERYSVLVAPNSPQKIEVRLYNRGITTTDYGKGDLTITVECP